MDSQDTFLIVFGRPNEGYGGGVFGEWPVQSITVSGGSKTTVDKYERVFSGVQEYANFNTMWLSAYSGDMKVTVDGVDMVLSAEGRVHYKNMDTNRGRLDHMYQRIWDWGPDIYYDDSEPITGKTFTKILTSTSALGQPV